MLNVHLINSYSIELTDFNSQAQVNDGKMKYELKSLSPEYHKNVLCLLQFLKNACILFYCLISNINVLMKSILQITFIVPFLLISCASEDSATDLIDYSDLPEIPYHLDLEAGESENYFPARLNELFVSSGGSIIVSDHGSTTLEQFSPNGKHLKTIASQGGGPGELPSFFFLADVGNDHLMVEHQGTRRDFFQPNENGIYSYQSTITSDEGSMVGSTTLGLRTDNQLYASPRNVIRNPQELMVNPPDYRTQKVIIIDTESNMLRDSLVTLRTPYPHLTESGGGFRIDLVPYRNIDRFIPMENGEYLVARPEQSTLSFFDFDHNLKNQLDLNIAPRPVERSDLDYAFRNTRTDVRRGIETRVHSHKPPFLDIFVSEEHLWLHTDNGEDGKEFVVFEMDGNPLGRFLLSEFDDVKKIIGTKIYSIHKDPDMGDSVRVYEVSLES